MLGEKLGMLEGSAWNEGLLLLLARMREEKIFSPNFLSWPKLWRGEGDNSFACLCWMKNEERGEE